MNHEKLPACSQKLQLRGAFVKKLWTFINYINTGPTSKIIVELFYKFACEFCKQKSGFFWQSRPFYLKGVLPPLVHPLATGLLLKLPI